MFQIFVCDMVISLKNLHLLRIYNIMKYMQEYVVFVSEKP